jgi:hypothetical protein
MAGFNAIELDAGKIVGSIKVRLKLRGARRSAFRIWFGAQIIRLGFLVTGMSGELTIGEE